MAEEKTGLHQTLSLRARFVLFFAAIAGAGTLAIIGGLWLGYSKAGGGLDGYVIAGLVGSFGLAAVTVAVALLFDENVARPIQALASDLSTRARADVGAEIDQHQARYLGALAPSAAAIHDALAEARSAAERAVAERTARIRRENAVFEGLIRDLAEGIVVTTGDGRVMLYNRAAEALLGSLGLDRPLTQYIRAEPLTHAEARLSARQQRGEAGPESFLVATEDGSRFLLARLGKITAGNEPVGRVLMFHDATDDLDAHAERDHLFNSLLEGVRRPASAISALLDGLESGPDLPDDLRATFDAAMAQELEKLTVTLGESAARADATRVQAWPMGEVTAEDIFDGLRAGFPEASLDCEGGAERLRCDGFAVLELMRVVLSGLIEAGAEGIRLRAEPKGQEIWLVTEWLGPEIRVGQLEEWLEAPLPFGRGTYTGRDALEGHRTEIWPERESGGHRLVMPLEAASSMRLALGAERPEFYDFDLPTRSVSADLAEMKLRDLTFTVFDTETTGLSPRSGDEIVQIAALRIVNGRILRGEPFETLVNPGRPIPAASTKVHHIDDAMVASAPGIASAGQAFHDYAEGSVLVAHNAPFDLAFLRLKEEAIGRRFGQPVLCTVLLSASLFEHSSKHTLDALADRFGVTIPPEARHTAMGDTIATAEVFLGMLRVMEAEGVTTLGGALNLTQRMTKIREAQSNY